MSENVWIGIVSALLLALQGSCLWILNATHKKISDICQKNEIDHREIWKGLNHHGHTCCDQHNPKVYVEGM